MIFPISTHVPVVDLLVWLSNNSHDTMHKTFCWQPFVCCVLVSFCVKQLHSTFIGFLIVNRMFLVVCCCRPHHLNENKKCKNVNRPRRRLPSLSSHRFDNAHPSPGLHHHVQDQQCPVEYEKLESIKIWLDFAHDDPNLHLVSQVSYEELCLSRTPTSPRMKVLDTIRMKTNEVRWVEHIGNSGDGENAKGDGMQATFICSQCLAIFGSVILLWIQS